MPRPPIQPIEVHRDGDRTVESHPAFGVVSLHRVTGHPGELFGTEVACLDGAFFALRIHEAERTTMGAADDRRVFARKLLVEVALSPAQFVRMLTSLNAGAGTPVTLRSVDVGAFGSGERASLPVDEADHARLVRETEARLRALTAKATAANVEIQMLVALGAKMTAADRKRIGDLSAALLREFSPDNIGFAVQLVQEAAEKVVTEAQANVDAFIQTAVMDLGERALAAGARPALPEGVLKRLVPPPSEGEL